MTGFPGVYSGEGKNAKSGDENSKVCGAGQGGVYLGSINKISSSSSSPRPNLGESEPYLLVKLSSLLPCVWSGSSYSSRTYLRLLCSLGRLILGPSRLSVCPRDTVLSRFPREVSAV